VSGSGKVFVVGSGRLSAYKAVWENRS